MIGLKQVLQTSFKIILIDKENKLASNCNKWQVKYLGALEMDDEDTNNMVEEIHRLINSLLLMLYLNVKMMTKHVVMKSLTIVLLYECNSKVSLPSLIFINKAISKNILEN